MRSGILLAATTLILVSTGCHAPKGKTVTEKRHFVDRMRREALAQLYKEKPEAQAKVENGAGYAVFSDFGYALVFGGSAHGYGVLVNNSDGSKTYMRMIEGSEGLGIGVKEFRKILVFNDQESYDSFVKQGLEFGTQAEATAKQDDGEGSSSGGTTLNRGVEVYTMTTKGFFVRLAVSGAIFYKDKELNE